MPATNPNLPPNAPAASPPPPEFTAAQTKKGLEELRLEMMKPEKLGAIMKQFEKHKVNTGPWDNDPKSAIDSVKRYFPDGDHKKILLFALNSDITSQEFEYGKKALSIITKHAAEQQLAIDKARLDLSKLNENSLNRVAQEGVTSVLRGAMRGDITDQLIFGTTALVFLNHIFNNDPKNRLLRPFAFAGMAYFGINSAALHLTGTSVSDAMDSAGVPLQPSMRKQLPQQAREIAGEAGLSSSPTLYALGKLGEHKMSVIYSHYEAGKKKKSIDPYLFGFDTHQIKGDELFKIVDTVVKRHEERRIAGRLDGKTGNFKRDFVDVHDYDFLEVTSLLYRNEIQDAARVRLTPEGRLAYEQKLMTDTKRMFENTNVKPDLKDGMMEFYGVKFFTPMTAERETPFGSVADAATAVAIHRYHIGRTAEPEVVYTYKLGPNRVVTCRMDENTDKRQEQAVKLKEYAMDFVKETVKHKAPSSPALSGVLTYVEIATPAYKGLEFQNVVLKGRRYTVRVSDEAGGELVAVIQDGTPAGKRVTDWNKLAEAV